METANKLIYKQTNYFKEDGEKYRIIVIVSLDDDCHNNIYEWSITANIRQKNKYEQYEEYMGGCCHDEIVKYVPELAKFIPNFKYDKKRGHDISVRGIRSKR